MQFNANYKVYFDTSDPLVNDFLETQQLFSTRDPLILVLQSESVELQTIPNFFARSQALVTELQALENLVSIQTYLSALANPEDEFSAPEAGASVFHQLLSGDGHHALMVLDLALDDETNANEILSTTTRVHSALERAFTDTPINFYLSGTLGLNRSYIETVRHDLRLFIPGLLLIMISFLWLIFRRLSIPLMLIGTGLVSTFAAFGILGWLGYSLAAINAFTPVMIIGLSMVTAMHNVLGFHQSLSEGHSANQSLSDSFRLNFKPLTLSCITTAAGFLFLLSSPSPPIRVTGIATALGILFSLAITLSWLQSGLLRWAPSQTQAAAALRRIRIDKLKIESKTAVILWILAGSIVATMGLNRLQIDDNVYRYFPDDHPFRQSIGIVDTHFGGIARLNYLFQVTEPGQTLLDAGPMSQIQKFVGWLEQDPQIKKISPAPEALTSQSLAFLLQPLIAQELGMQHFVSADQKSLRIQLNMHEQTAAELVAVDQRITAWLHNNISQIQTRPGQSADLLFAHLGRRNAESMAFSLLVALALISLIIGLSLKSVSATLAALICNFFPVLVVYGIWGLAGAHISLGSALVIGMIIGVIVDDSIHLLFKHRQYCLNRSNDDAISELWQRVQPAVFISSLTLILALLVGLLSDFRPIAEVSLLSTGVIAAALITDMYMLPALLKTAFFAGSSNITATRGR